MDASTHRVFDLLLHEVVTLKRERYFGDGCRKHNSTDNDSNNISNSNNSNNDEDEMGLYEG